MAKHDRSIRERVAAVIARLRAPRYQRCDTGETTTGDDPDRSVWYAAGNCGYWTDDWSKVGSGERGIPCCPLCRAVGFYTHAGKWTDGAEKFEADGHPRYLEFLGLNKERCVGRGNNLGFTDRYEVWLKEQG
jgi:hypothetical protein